jgi:hypothetical protein
MGSEHTAREKQRAPIGEYRPEVYRVKVYDTFEQHRLRLAASLIRNGMSVPEFFLYSAKYVLRNHRKLKRLRSVFRQGAREIHAAMSAPIPSGFSEPESERDRRRRDVVLRVCSWARRELHADITGDRL